MPTKPYHQLMPAANSAELAAVNKVADYLTRCRLALDTERSLWGAEFSEWAIVNEKVTEVTRLDHCLRSLYALERARPQGGDDGD